MVLRGDLRLLLVLDPRACSGPSVARSSLCIGLDAIVDPAVPPDGNCIADGAPLAFEIGD